MPNTSRRAQLEQMLRENPGDDFLEYGLAVEFLNEGKIDEGVGRFKRIIERSPDYCAAYFRAGQALAAAERPSEARAMLESGIAAAQRAGNAHAAAEMQDALSELPPQR
jgi:tetratricopeptide (TPR) repeat protein